MKRLALLVALSIALACGGCHRPPERPNFLLVTFDTTRADHTSLYGYGRPTTPHLERFAAGAVRFTQAATPMPVTDPAHMAILTGRDPFRTGVEENGIPMSDDEVTLAEVLRGSGYRTAAFTSVRHLGTRGYEQGFDVYEYPRHEHQVKGDVTLGRALSWLDAGPPEPFFLWVHFFDPHMDYNAPEPFKTRFGEDPVARYDGEIAFADDCFGRLMRHLEESGLFDRTAVVVASDHGEHLLEGVAVENHPDYRFHHGHTVYDFEIRVILLTRLPGLAPHPAVIDAPAALADVFPTLLAYLQVPLPRNVVLDGVSLLGLLGGRGDAGLPRRASFSYTIWNRGPWICARGGGWKLVQDIRDGSTRAFNLREDPGEAAALAAGVPPEARGLAAALDDWFERKERVVAARPPRDFEYDPETLENLRALGYFETGEPAEGIP